MKRLFLILLVPIFGLLLSGCTTAKPPAANLACDQEKGCQVSPNVVPLPTEESTVRTFFGLIAEKRIPEAVNMLSTNASPDESTKQMWGVNFASINKLTIKSIERSDNNFKVTLVLEVNNPGEYNWENGENLRWITVVKENDAWKIDSIATGP